MPGPRYDVNQQYPERQLKPGARTESFLARRSGSMPHDRHTAPGMGAVVGGAAGGGGARPPVSGLTQNVASLPDDPSQASPGVIYNVPDADGAASRLVTVIRNADGTQEFRDVMQRADAWPAAFVGEFGEEGTADGEFGEMQGLGVDPVDENVYVASDDRIQEFTANGTFVATRATVGTGNGQVAAPAGLWFSPIGNGGDFFVADAGNDRYQIFDNDAYQSKRGATGTGDGQFDSPTSVLRVGLVDLVVDSGNNRVMAFNNGDLDWDVFSSETFSAPTSVAVDPEGRFWITDTGTHRILVFTLTNTFTGAATLNFVIGGLGSTPGMFNAPHSIAFDSQGNAHITDFGNNRVQVFDRNGIFQGSYGKLGSGDGEFDGPTAIAITDENVYVADAGNFRVQMFANPAARPRNDGLKIDFVMYDGGTVTQWTNQPAAATEFMGNQYFRKRVDLTGMTELRLVAELFSAPGHTTATLNVQYSTDAGSTWADAGVSAGDLITIAAVGERLGAWTDLVAGAKTDVLLRLLGAGGNAVADPWFTNVSVQVR